MVLRIINVCVCVLNSYFRSQNKRMRMYLFLLGWYASAKRRTSVLPPGALFHPESFALPLQLPRLPPPTFGVL